MIIKKLAVPLINDKILQQAEHCYIATAGISETAFDFIKNRLSPKCKIDIVTGLDSLTSPRVLRRIWRHYQDRITLRIYSRNTFHANVYIFDLPFRKSVAFSGSGQFSMEGIKDHEEIFNKTTDAKEIEALMSWYTSYFEFGETLTEALVNEYELVYPFLKQKEIASRAEKRQFMELSTAGFNWDSIKFKNQYFKKEDYLVLGNLKATSTTDEMQASRLTVQAKLILLNENLSTYITGAKLQQDLSDEVIARNTNPLLHVNQRLRTMNLVYGIKDADLKKMDLSGSQTDHISFHLTLRQKDVGISLVVGNSGKGKEDREHFTREMNNIDYRKTFHTLLAATGGGYWIEIAGDKKACDSFQNEELLWEFTKEDQWQYFDFSIGKNYQPGDPSLSNDTVVTTITSDIDKLMPLFNHLRFKQKE